MKKKKLWVLVIGAILISSLVLLAFSRQGAEIAVTSAKIGDIKKYVEDIGTVKCKDQKMVSIEGSGLIQSISVDIGQQVKKGDILLTMESKQLEIQLRDIEEKIRETQASFEGSEIKNYASNVEKARIEVNQAKEAYELALDDYNKIKALAEAGAASVDMLKKTESALKGAESLMKTAEISLQQIEANTPDSVKTVYKAQLEQLVLAKEGIMHSLKKQELVSPIDGVIMEKKVEVNTIGVTGTVAFVVGDVEELEIEANILADEVADIKLGNQVEITERSEKKQIFEGKIIKIAPGAVTVTSSLGVNQKRVAVTIEPMSQSELLRPGYEVDVKIITERKNGVVTVPQSSVFEYKGKDSIFVVVDGKAILKEIKKGIKDEESVEILEGLKEGELILEEPDINVKEGMRIKLDKSAD